MTHCARLLQAVVVLSLIALTSFNGVAQDVPEPAGVDFKAGGNTWADSKVGDFVEYTLGPGPRVKFSVTAVSETGDITFDHIIFNDKGEEVANNSRTRAPAKAPMQGRVPDSIPVTWGAAEYSVGDITLSCTTATWAKEGSTGAIWFCKDLPCGGIVKTSTDGEDSVWLTSFSRDGKKH
ncbi:MAG: hypothetical protein KDB29_12425, partial [Planctomycetes bacterium]|nr:hypothetical protein [Planctomycetota bacterium]